MRAEHNAEKSVMISDGHLLKSCMGDCDVTVAKFVHLFLQRLDSFFIQINCIDPAFSANTFSQRERKKLGRNQGQQPLDHLKYKNNIFGFLKNLLRRLSLAHRGKFLSLFPSFLFIAKSPFVLG